MMNNPFLSKARRYGENVLHNPVYCLKCNKKYTEKPNDINSLQMDQYCRYLGYCHENCFDKVSPDLQHDMTSYAYTDGCKVKLNHKFFMENVKGYDSVGKVKRP